MNNLIGISIQVFVVIWLLSGWLASWAEIRKLKWLRTTSRALCISGVILQLPVYAYILWRVANGSLWQTFSWRILLFTTGIYLIPFVFFSAGWFYYRGFKRGSLIEKRIAGLVGLILLVMMLVSLSFFFIQKQ